MKFLKTSRVCLVTRGRYAGKKVRRSGTSVSIFSSTIQANDQGWESLGNGCYQSQECWAWGKAAARKGIEVERAGQQHGRDFEHHQNKKIGA
jgi:hypothetical protein